MYKYTFDAWNRVVDVASRHDVVTVAKHDQEKPVTVPVIPSPPNNGMQRTALRTAADAERYISKFGVCHA